MKTCNECKTSKNLDQFNKNKARKDGYSNVCRECMKIFRKRHYDQNSQKVYGEVKARRKDLLDRVWQYKCEHPCVDCGESNAIMLEFDHIPERTAKEFNISAAIQRGFSWDRILQEIQKCEVVCANHHRVRTHTRGGWVRNITVRL